MPARKPPLPTFVIIGAQKSATRWLRHNLGLHPEIFTARQELKFFNHPKRYAALKSDWYRAQFAGWEDEPITGESTPGYLMFGHQPAEVAHRIQATVPDAQLIALLRNPVDRANSALVHHIRAERIHPRTRLLDWARSQPPESDWMGLITGGWYAASLEPYLRSFGDQLLVVLHDDVQANPHRAYADVLDHVGAAADFVPPALAELYASNQKDAPSRISAEERLALFEFFRDDVSRLERMLGRDLSIWRPESEPDDRRDSHRADGTTPTRT